MGPDKTITIEATMPERWVPHFVGMLNMMQYLGSIGSSRTVALFADGDGDFQPRFEISPEVEGAAPAHADSDDGFFWDAG